MKIGYPCINWSIGCTPNTTFRLKSYSKERMISTIQTNLDCLKKTLEFNVKHNLMFFRIGSQLVPFASHEVCKFDWQKFFKNQFEEIGEYIKKHQFRISMHPDQFTLLNAKDKKIIDKSIHEIDYHCKVLDLMKLDETAKVQIHIGGVYKEREKSIERFVEEYKKLPKHIKKRLVIENDHNRFSLQDCIQVHEKTKIPIIFDSLHHECLNNGETFREAMELSHETWSKKDGIPMVDYSSQKKDGIKGSHAYHIDMNHFKNFLKETKGLDFDIMLEIKDKETSALEAIKIL